MDRRGAAVAFVMLVLKGGCVFDPAGVEGAAGDGPGADGPGPDAAAFLDADRDGAGPLAADAAADAPPAPDGTPDASPLDAPAPPDAAPPDAAPPDAAPPDAPMVPCAGYAFYPSTGSWYRVETDGLQWPAAEARCESHGAHLVVIGDGTENELVRTLIGGSSWIGLTDYTDEGTFLWVTDTPLGYTNWASDEPNDGGAFSGEDAVEMRTDGLWNDLAGRANDRPSVCECDGAAADPARFDM